MESPLGERFEIIPPDDNFKPTAGVPAFIATKTYDNIISHDDSKSITKEHVVKKEEKPNSKDSENSPITRNRGFSPVALPEDIEAIDSDIGEDDTGGPPASLDDDFV